jgi:hypothetical protein
MINPGLIANTVSNNGFRRLRSCKVLPAFTERNVETGIFVFLSLLRVSDVDKKRNEKMLLCVVKGHTEVVNS